MAEPAREARNEDDRRTMAGRRMRWVWWFLTPLALIGSGLLNLAIVAALAWFFAVPRIAEDVVKVELAREGFAIENVDIARVSMGGVSLANIRLVDGPSIGRLDLDWEAFDDSGTPILDRLALEGVEISLRVDETGEVSVAGFDLSPDEGAGGAGFALPRLPISVILVYGSLVHLDTPFGRFSIPVSARVEQAEDRTLTVSADLALDDPRLGLALATDLVIEPGGRISLDADVTEGAVAIAGISLEALQGWASLTVGEDGRVDSAIDLRGESLSLAGVRLEAPHLIAFGGTLPEFVTFSAREASSGAAVVADLLAGTQGEALSSMTLNLAADIPEGEQAIDGGMVRWDRVWLEVSAEISAAMIERMTAERGAITPEAIAANLPPVAVSADVAGVDWPGLGSDLTLRGRSVLSLDGSAVAARFSEDLRLSGVVPALGGAVAATLSSPGGGRQAMLSYDWQSDAWRAVARVEGNHIDTGPFGGVIEGSGHGDAVHARLREVSLAAFSLGEESVSRLSLTSLELRVEESGRVRATIDDFAADSLTIAGQTLEGVRADDLSALVRADGSLVDVASDIVADRIALDFDGTLLTIRDASTTAAVTVAGEIVTIALHECIAFSALDVDADGVVVGVSPTAGEIACVDLAGDSAVVWPTLPEPLMLDLTAGRFTLASEGDTVVSVVLNDHTALSIPSFDPFAIAGTLDAVNLTVEAADLRFPGTTATVDASFGEATDVAIDIDWATLIVPGQPAPVRPSGVAGQIAIDDAGLTFSGGAYPASGVLLPVSVRHDFDSGAGQADIRIAALTLEVGGLQPHDIFPAVDLRALGQFGGTVGGQATLRWSESLSTAAQVNLSGIRLSGVGYSASGINGTLTFSSLDPPRTAGPQSLSADLLDVGVMLRNGRAQLAIVAGDTVTVSDARFAWAGGTLSAAPFTIPLANPNTSVNFSAQGIDLTALLIELPVEGLSATGVLDGTVPVRVIGDSVHIDNGQLQSRGPGVIRYASGGVGDGQDEGVQLLLDAIQNFHYESLGVSLDGRTGGDLTVGLTIRGANPDVYDGYPIALNVNVSGALDDILSEGIQTLTIGDRAREYFQDETTRGTLENIIGR
ncbi:MAG: YdbH domain-containing protein [Azospirillaceae bacterium]